MVANSFFFMAAGNETTSTALTFAVYCLACHPAAEAALLAEVDAFGRERAPGFPDLGSFPYVDAVLKEALRLYPPVHITTRQAEADLLVGGTRVPAGTPLQVLSPAAGGGLAALLQFRVCPPTSRPASQSLTVACLPRLPPQVSLYGLHRSPRYWRDPDAFCPERFLEGAPQASGNDLGAYQPFGDGPRGCVGSTYATQVRLALLMMQGGLLSRKPGCCPP